MQYLDETNHRQSKQINYLNKTNVYIHDIFRNHSKSEVTFMQGGNAEF